MGVLYIHFIYIYIHRRHRHKYATDSDDFREALEIWIPWISYKSETPRAVKRFLNHLRFLAARNHEGIRDSELVALASIYNAHPDWLLDDAAFARLMDGRTEELLQERYPPDPDNPEHQQVIAQLAHRLNRSLQASDLDGLKAHREQAIRMLHGSMPRHRVQQDEDMAEGEMMVAF